MADTPSHGEHSARSAAAITPSDSVNLAVATRGLYVGVAGDVVVLMADDSAVVTLKNLAAGSVHPISVKRVNSTDTTATDIVGLF